MEQDAMPESDEGVVEYVPVAQSVQLIDPKMLCEVPAIQEVQAVERAAE